MFPLDNRKLIRGCTAHIKARLGCAADYEAKYVPFRIPFTGTVEIYTGTQGGKWLRLIRDDNGDRIELAHLSRYSVTSGRVLEGEAGGLTGNTGTITDYPHLHIQIFRNGQRLDPEQYDWTMPTIKFPITLLTTQAWTTPQVQESVLEVLKASEGRLEVIETIIQKQFLSIPFTQYPDYKRVDDQWYKTNIVPLCSGVPMFHMVISEWQGNSTLGIETIDGIHFRADQGETFYYPQNNVTVKAFVMNFVHELSHRLFRITGQSDITHQFMYPPSGVWNPKGAYSKLDFSKLTTNTMAQIKTQAKGPERRIVLIAADPIEWNSLCKVFGKDPNKVEETVS